VGVTTFSRTSQVSIALVSVAAMCAVLYAVYNFYSLVYEITDLRAESKQVTTIWAILDGHVSNVLGFSAVTFMLWMLDTSDDKDVLWERLDDPNLLNVVLKSVYFTMMAFNSGDGQFLPKNTVTFLWFIVTAVFGVMAQTILFGIGINLSSNYIAVQNDKAKELVPLTEQHLRSPVRNGNTYFGLDARRIFRPDSIV